MNRILKNVSVAVITVLLAASCQRDVQESQSGWLNINLNKDTSEDIIFKSVSAPEDGQVFDLEFIRKGVTVATAVHTVGAPSEPIELPVGPYVVKAATGDNDEAAFNEPYYTGEATVDIVADTEHSLEIVCYLSNVKVTVDFSMEIEKNFSDYKVIVTNSRGGSLVFEDETLTEAGYFKVGENETLSWTLELVNNKGVKYTASGMYEGVLPKEHYNLNFSLGEAAPDYGGMYLTIKVDDSTEVKDYPAHVDFGGNAGPVVTVNPEFQKLIDNGTIPFGVQETKVVTMTAAKGLKSAVIRHSDAALYAKGLPYFTELVGISQSQLSALESIGIKTSAYSYGSGNPVVVDITGFMSELAMDTNYKFNLAVYDVYNHSAVLELDFTVVVDAAADMVSVSAGADAATVVGKWFVDPKPEGLTFWYKKATEVSWNVVDQSAVRYDESAKTMTAVLTGLLPGGTYLVKAVADSDTETREMTFTTEAPQLFNMGFEYWYISGKLYYPYPQGATAGQKVWDSANKALTDFGQNSSTTYVTDHVKEGSRAVRMESKNVMGIAFAAGNIYTGEFLQVVTSGGTGARLAWGTEFGYRPVALRGWYDYKSTSISAAKDPYSGMKGQPDKCQILVMLTDWTEPFEINTVKGQFVDFENDEHIIAFAKFQSEVTTGGYVEFCLPLEYRNSRTPKYAVIACASSYLGDYFTGGVGSTLYVDGLSFEYDITTLSEEDQAKVNYK